MKAPALLANCLVALVLTEATLLYAKPAQSVTLIENGQARCTIVVPLEEKRITEVAEDLRYHLGKMSGAHVLIVNDPTQVKGVGIYIDTKPPNVHVPGRFFSREGLWPDGYVIEVIEFDGKTGVFLSSPCPEGVAHAVYGLLEDYLGCHWFTPGEIGEHIPQRRTVTLHIPSGREVAKPSFEKRGPWYNDNVNGRMTYEEIALLNKWYRRNRRGEPRGYAGHNWKNIFPKELREEAPELAAFFKGKRHPEVGGLCMSNPRTVEIASHWFINFFNDHPDFDYYSFSQSDSPEWCRCDECLQMASNDGARMLLMSNRVAEKLAEVHPTRRITIMPYKATLEPPKEFIQGHPNLAPVIVSMGVDQVRPRTNDNPSSNNYRRQVAHWMKMLPQAWSYDYVGVYNGPWPLFHALQETQDFYRSVGYTGVMDEYLSRNMGTDIHIWLSTRMAWDKRLRVEDLLNAFYPAYFGAAAEDMRQIYERFEQQMLSVEGGSSTMTDVPRFYPARLVDDSLAQIAKAKRKVADNPTIVARIERDENCLLATKLWLVFWSALGQANRSGSDEERQSAASTCRAYLDFVSSLNGTLTLGGKAHIIAERSLTDLTGSGTYFEVPGPFIYWDNLDQGGKSYHARSRKGFYIGAHGLYLKPGVTGEIVYDFRAAEGLKFKEVSLPGGPGGWDTAIHLALPAGGHNKVQISPDQGQTWMTTFEELDNRGDVVKYDLTDYVGGKNQFLLKFWVQNTDEEILGLDTWVITGTIE